MFRCGRAHPRFYAVAIATAFWATVVGAQSLEPPPTSNFEERFSAGENRKPVFAMPAIQRVLAALPSSLAVGVDAASIQIVPEVPELPTQETASFEERFLGLTSTEPLFVQPDVQQLVASLPPGEDENAAVAEAEPEVLHTEEDQAVAAIPESAAQPEEQAEVPQPEEDRAARVEQGVAEGDDARQPDATASLPVPPADEQNVPARDETVRDPQATASVEAAPAIATGRATWYEHPGQTASGEIFDPNDITAAHRTLPFGTRVRVVNQITGQSVVVRINDRIPRSANTMIDLSRASARRIGITGDGMVALYHATGQATRTATVEHTEASRR